MAHLRNQLNSEYGSYQKCSYEDAYLKMRLPLSTHFVRGLVQDMSLIVRCLSDTVRFFESKIKYRRIDYFVEHQIYYYRLSARRYRESNG